MYIMSKVSKLIKQIMSIEVNGFWYTEVSAGSGAVLCIQTFMMLLHSRYPNVQHVNKH